MNERIDPNSYIPKNINAKQAIVTISIKEGTSMAENTVAVKAIMQILIISFVAFMLFQ